MPSRYLLIEFDDAAQADKLRQQIDARKGISMRVVGLFAKPLPPYCGCGKEITMRAQKSTLKRGARFGWWVCTECKRPSASVSGLKNLIAADDIINPPTHKVGLFNLIHYFWSISAPEKARS
jgi:hypothetical protein